MINKTLFHAYTEYGEVFWDFDKYFKHYIHENDATWRHEYFKKIIHYFNGNIHEWDDNFNLPAEILEYVKIYEPDYKQALE